MSKNGKGDCYKAAHDCVMELAELMKAGLANQETLFLIHGSIVPPSGPAQGKRINHAWVVKGDVSLEVSNGQKIPAPTYNYDAVYHAQERVRYTPEKALEELREAGHFGPWDT